MLFAACAAIAVALPSHGSNLPAAQGTGAGIAAPIVAAGHGAVVPTAVGIQHRIRVRHARQGTMDAQLEEGQQQQQQHKAWVRAEEADMGGAAGRGRARVLGRCTIREALLTADCAEQCATEDPLAEPMVMRAFVSSLRLDEGWRRTPVRLDTQCRLLAADLMRECEDIARTWGYGETWLHVQETNEGAVRFYVDELGFEIMSEKTVPRSPSTSYCLRKELAPPEDGAVAAAPQELADAMWRGCHGRVGPRAILL